MKLKTDDIVDTAKKVQYLHSLYGAITSNRPPIRGKLYETLANFQQEIWSEYCAAEQELRDLELEFFNERT